MRLMLQKPLDLMQASTKSSGHKWLWLDSLGGGWSSMPLTSKAKPASKLRQLHIFYTRHSRLRKGVLVVPESISLGKVTLLCILPSGHEVFAFSRSKQERDTWYSTWYIRKRVITRSPKDPCREDGMVLCMMHVGTAHLRSAYQKPKRNWLCCMYGDGSPDHLLSGSWVALQRR
jgi:hypothetical protein